MTIYVDQLTRSGNGWWCHMATDDDLEELHKLAFKIGLQRKWFQDHSRVPHYDLHSSKRMLAVEYGAVQVTAKELFQKCKVRK